jgi:hypothetical protein
MTHTYILNSRGNVLSSLVSVRIKLEKDTRKYFTILFLSVPFFFN